MAERESVDGLIKKKPAHHRKHAAALVITSFFRVSQRVLRVSKPSLRKQQKSVSYLAVEREGQP